MPLSKTKKNIFKAIKRENIQEVEDILNDPEFNPQQYDSQGLTPLCLSIRIDSFTIFELLLKCSKLDPNFPNPINGWTALFYCVESGGDAPIYIKQINTFKKLDVNVQDKSGNTALHFATASNLVSVAELLITLHADVNPINNNKETPLHHGILSGSLETVSLLLQYGANPYTYQKEGYSSLHLSIQQNNENVTHTLLTYMPKPFINASQIVDNELNSPLHHAVLYNNSSTITKLLEDYGFDWDSVNSSGKSARDLQNIREEERKVTTRKQKEDTETRKQMKIDQLRLENKGTEVHKFCLENNLSENFMDNLFKMNHKTIDDSFLALQPATLERWGISKNDISAFIKGQERIFLQTATEAKTLLQHQKKKMQMREKKNNYTAMLTLSIIFALIYLAFKLIIRSV